MIESLTATNFKKHRSLEMRFSEGVNLLVGPNYSGKSSAIMAILYTLFGPSSVPGGAKHAKTRGVRNRPKTELSLSVSGHQYVITRSGSSAKLERVTEEGKDLVASGQSAVTKEVESLLGMSAKTFQLLRTSPQDEVQAILTLGSEKLSALVNEITQVDVIDKVIARAKAAMPEEVEEPIPPEKLEAMRKALEEQRSELTSQWKVLESCQQRKSALESETEQAGVRYAEVREAYHAAERARNSRWEFEWKLRQAEERLSQQQKVVENSPLPDISADERLYEEAKKALEEALYRSARTATVKKSLEDVEATIKDAEELASQEPAFREEVERLMKEMEGSRKQEEALKQTYFSALKVRDTLSSEIQSGVCSACGRPFEGFDEETHRRKLDEAELRLIEAHRAVTARSATTQDLEKKLGEKSSALERAKQAASLVEDAQGRKNLLLLELKELEAASPETIESLRDRVTELETSLNNGREALLKAQQARDAANQTQMEVAHLKEVLERLPKPENVPSLEDVEKAEATYSSLSKDLQRLSVQLSHTDRSYREKYAEFQLAQSGLEEAEKRAEDVRFLIKRRDTLTRLIKYLRKNRDRFLSEVWSQLLGYASEFASMSTGGDIVAVSRSPEGEFLFDEGEGLQPIVTASGVQKAIIGVGVRLALAEALRTGTDFMLLDEVTAGASDEVSMAMTRALAASGVQIIAVTHRQNDAAVADNVIPF